MIVVPSGVSFANEMQEQPIWCASAAAIMALLNLTAYDFIHICCVLNCCVYQTIRSLTSMIDRSCCRLTDSKINSSQDIATQERCTAAARDRLPKLFCWVTLSCQQMERMPRKTKPRLPERSPAGGKIPVRLLTRRRKYCRPCQYNHS